MAERTVTVKLVETEGEFNWEYLAELIARNITKNISKGDSDYDGNRKVQRTA